MKKEGKGTPPHLNLAENPDILRSLAQGDSKSGNQRPALVVGFAAETEDLIDNAVAKRKRKGCDWIVANDVSIGTGTFAGDDNRVHLITEGGVEDWPRMSKVEVAERLAGAVADHFEARS